MHGKATLSLIDKDTGRIVKQTEETNMFTNALRNIFDFPKHGLMGNEMSYVFPKYLPMHQYLLHGIVLFGCNVPQNADDFMIGSRYDILATAGGGYSGGDPMRGTFNENQSCEIPNGYRFVWDFAPEKACGTIKCLGLTNLHMGNMGNGAFAGAEGCVNANVYNLSNPMGGSALTLAESTYGESFLACASPRRFYTYTLADHIPTMTITIREYVYPDYTALRINDTPKPVLTREYSADFPHTITDFHVMFNDAAGKIVISANGYYPINNNHNTSKTEYSVIDLASGALESSSGVIILDEEVPAHGASTVFGGKIYIANQYGNVYVFSLSGGLERILELNMTQIRGFYVMDGELVCYGQFRENQKTGCVYIGENIRYYSGRMSKTFRSEDFGAPYCILAEPPNTVLGMRTDYLATINNLSEPLAKTDRHALQVRYEVTN